ncbi:MAG: DUF695 domain-containing protein [Muribaculaceae bacterium]|nr:DUF695 domain-containing protein [Muribaculaceae bacterium]
MAKETDWWTSPTESEDGRLIMVTGRRDIDKFRNNPRFTIRVDISWTYDESPAAAMPSVADSEIMEQATESINAVLDKDPVAVMTGIYTGAGRRDWVFYTLSTNIFNKKLNEALADLPLLPLQIYAENDPEWAEYEEMREISEIN